jgi:hypothetical protein
MGNTISRRPAWNRYFVVYDPVDEDDKIYGILIIDTKDVKTNIVIQFFNDEGYIDLGIREISKIEWETMKAFELFPVLTPYYRDPVTVKSRGWYPRWKTPIEKHMSTIFKVRFRDY